MSKLNKDILFLLFEELQDDSKSLFSCLLVNRLWCETVVLVLWKNPWCYDISYRNKSSLFNIVTLSLSDDIKEILIAQGIQFSSTTLQQPLLFDYLSFCRSMNVNAINDIISVGYFSTYNRFLLQKEIYGLFMRKCPELKYLDMRSIEHQLFYFPKADARLDSLCELICDTNNDSIYFYGLACICNGIEKLIIVNNRFKADDGIVKLIKTQRNLKYFEWKEDFDDWDEFVGEFYEHTYKNTYLALVEKAHTLTHFIITSFERAFSPEVLPELHKLKTLKLNLYDQFDYKYEEELKNSVYPDLEVLQLEEDICINVVTSIIKNSEGRIRKILINNYFIDSNNGFYEQSLSLIYAIYEKCPLVEYLSITFPSSKEHFIEFEKLLKACQKLRVLLLDFKHTDDAEFLKVLNRSAPINLREIRFHFKFSLETLEEFLENWRGRPALSILTTNRDYGNEEYMEIVNRYKNDAVLKDFRHVSRRDMYC